MWRIQDRELKSIKVDGNARWVTRMSTTGVTLLLARVRSRVKQMPCSFALSAENVCLSRVHKILISYGVPSDSHIALYIYLSIDKIRCCNPPTVT